MTRASLLSGKTFNDPFSFIVKNLTARPLYPFVDDYDFLGHRKIVNGEASPFIFESYGHVGKRVTDLGAALAGPSLSVPPKANIGLFSINRPEWIIAEQACFMNSFVTVPLYDTYGDEAIVYIAEQTEMSIAFASAEKIPTLIRLKDRLPHLLRIISMDLCLDAALIQKAEQGGLEIVYFEQLEEAGRALKVNHKPAHPRPEDLCTICYTSGTTGKPKGVMFAHRALLSSAAAALRMLGFPNLPKAEVSPYSNFPSLDLGIEVYLSYLPLAHIFERVVMVAMMIIGTKVGFSQGDVLRLMDDLAALQPTIFVSVPRLFNRVYDKVMSGVAAKGGLSQWLFDWAYETKLANLRADGSLTHWLYDRLVFGPIRARLGGRVKAMITGSAPLSPKVIDFLRIVFACPVLEGYGMTETSAVTCLTTPGDLACPQLGVPSPCVEVRLEPLPEMGYDESNRSGEVWVRGPSCFSGYYKAPVELQAETMKADGWVATGDVGQWDPQGRLLMVDRKKSLFKLAQGEYVAPERVEAVLCRHPAIAQAYVEGNSLRSSLVAIIVPAKDDGLLPWYASVNGLAEPALDDVMADPKLPVMLVADIVARFGTKGSGELKGFEVPKAIHIEPTPFSIENDLLTPTFKLKRPIVKQRYSQIVESLYSGLSE